jgi:ubiquinone/menaquinone biosynthesis C-methylase UbiE
MSLDQPTIQSAKLTGPEIKQRYTSIANVYDIWGKLTESKAQTRCLELANIVDGQAVLEVADNLRVGSAYHLPYDENSFDVLINNYMFDLLPQEDFERVLTEFGRVLRPSGRLVLANMAREGHWYNQLWEAVYRIQPAWLGGCRGVSLLPYVQRAGFTNTKREFISQMTFPSEIIYGERND